MTIKTFDANRVGGGTFQLEQDPLTGEYKVKEVGFVKLPELKLPEIEQAAPVVPDPTPDDPTDDDPADPGTGGGGSGGGGGERVDFTGESMLKNIQKEATTFAGQDTGIVPTTTRDRTDINEGAIKVEGLREKEAYDKAVANYNAIAERNRDLAMGRQPLSEEDTLQNKVDIDAARNEMDSARKNFESTFETIKAAPKISEDLQKFGPITTTGATGVPDMIVQGQPALPDQNVFSKAKEKARQIIDPSKLGAIKIMGGAAKVIGGILSGGREPTATQKLNTSLFQTRGDLGSSVDPGRIVGDPTKDLYAGMNRTSAYGNLEAAGNKRIATRTNTVNKRGVKDQAYAEANGLRYDPKGVSADFHRNTEGMKKQASKYKQEKEAAIDTSPGATGGEGGGSDKGSDSGKIVCTMMNESYGFGSFRNKIWMKFHGDIAPEYQKGYHKLFLPLVSYAKQKGITNKIIKNILEHIAVHSTIDMRQALRGKRHLLGRVYRKVILPLCYWAGRK